MNDHPSDQGPGAAGSSLELAALQQTYPGWWILPHAFGGFRAEWKSESGVQIHYVYGATVAELHKRLEVIEAARAEAIEA